MIARTIVSLEDPTGNNAAQGKVALVEHAWLYLLMLNLFGYAVFGKGWAYLGYPPVFIGELLLLCGLMVVFLSGRWSLFFQSWLLGPIYLLAIWGGLRTLPYLSEYGVFAVRDATIWGYSVFAVLVFVYVCTKPERLRILISGYGWLTSVFLCVMPFIWIPSQYLDGSLPKNLFTGLFLNAKAGDVGVHLAGIMSFWAVGLASPPTLRMIFAFCVSFAWVATTNRGGLLSFLVVVAFCCLFRPLNVAVWRFAFIGLTTMLILLAVDFQVEVPGRDRKIAASQVVENIASVASKTKMDDLNGTKQWRLNWWRDILDYTVFGKHFWDGKGFGVNLADDDGYQVTKDGSLRSPHNGHLTMLARAGVPGFLLWLTIHFGWLATISLAFMKSTRRGEKAWANLFLFLICYWGAFFANATFDVFLEGPMGGIWFWSLYGIGMASVRIYRYRPEILVNNKDSIPAVAQVA